MKQIVRHPEIGDLVFEVTTRVRGVRYSVSAERVRIAANPACAATVFPLSAERVAWILRAKQRLTTAQNELHFTPESTLQTNRFRVRFEQNNMLKSTFAAQLCGAELVLFYNNNSDFSDSTNQLKIRRIIACYLKRAAQAELPNRLRELAEKHDFSYTSVRISSAQTRWGSCSSQKHINLSYNLMLLPDRLIDFVLVHELCHTREMNHGPRFKQLICSIFPDHAALAAELKKHHTLPI